MNPIKVTYSDEKLRVLVEEYITMQKHEFVFKSLCSYVLYWAKEEGFTNEDGLYESNQLSSNDCVRLSGVLEKLVRESRIIASGHNKKASDYFEDETRFIKVVE